MLFSQPQVCEVIDNEFEPAWQTVREVPLVTVDFGSGRTARRTLHGNIATYILSPDGLVVDVIPGIYTPPAYVQRLEEARRVALALARVPASRRGAALSYYHQRRLEGLAAGERAPTAASGSALEVWEQSVRGARLLWEDAARNESQRRAKVELLLARAGATGPGAITRAVYREVLGVDLDDPLLGLGAALGPDPLSDP